MVFKEVIASLGSYRGASLARKNSMRHEYQSNVGNDYVTKVRKKNKNGVVYLKFL